MEIQYKTKKLKKECTIFTEAVKSYGHEMAVKLCSAKDRPSSDWKLAVASQV